MIWFFIRWCSSMLSIATSSILGYAMGSLVHLSLWGGAFGAIVALGVLALMDTIKSHGLIRWLSSSQELPLPRHHGLWGEINYRIERSIRSHEKAVAQEKNRLAQFLSAIEASPNGVLLLDTHDQITWCNAVAADHFGLNPHSDQFQPVTNLIRTPGFVTYMQGGLFDEPVLVPDVLRGQGTLSVLVRPYSEGLKLVLSQDATERERADAMRRDFVANVSHEIRTPLTVVSGFIETLNNLSLSEAEQREILSLMAQQTKRMQTLVNDLLTLALLEGSPRPPSDRWVPVSKLFELVHLDALALSEGRHDIVVETGLSAQVAGTESELLSALSNLVNNAVRYTPIGGCITISWQTRSAQAGAMVVQDTGIGINREHLPRLTERFYRVDSSRSRETGGTGLGLSIVKHVIHRHGGELEVRSENGLGSHFCLLFPASRCKP
jgi:two-component system, OmpR family, phosphate regulon sensor histidine kinase PhoR